MANTPGVDEEASEVEVGPTVPVAPSSDITVSDTKTPEVHVGLFSADIPGAVTQGLPGGSKPAPAKSSGKAAPAPAFDPATGTAGA